MVDITEKLSLQAHRCLGIAEDGTLCNKRITWSFCICKDCEKLYGRSSLQWPSWLRELWIMEQRDRRTAMRFATWETQETDYLINEEDDYDEFRDR